MNKIIFAHLSTTLILFSTSPTIFAQQMRSPFEISHRELLAITHVELVNGTGGPVLNDQTIVLRGDRIEDVGPSATTQIPASAEILNGKGKTVIPGLVAMHEHLFYPSPIAGPPVALEQMVSAPLLYLASGVTTARTTGSVDPYGDLEIKRAIVSGRSIGPDFDLTTPYLQGPGGPILQMHVLNGPDDARGMIDYWNSMGYTSTKAYNQITGAELKGAIEESHKLHMKITGHLCSVGFAQAVELGIDNLEHGPFAAPDGDLYLDKVKDECAAKTGGDSRAIGAAVVAGVEPTGQELEHTIRLMIEHHVALTSTLAVLEGGEELDLERNGRLKELLHPVAWDRIHELHRLELARGSYYANLLKKEMAFERAFVAQGGQLMFGCDPTGDGHTIAGLGDQRSLELLVEAGFTVPEVIQIATLNGAKFEGLADRLGTIAKGKRADIVVLDRNLAENFSAIESPLLVFKAGTEYDSHKIYESLRGQVGLH